MRNYTRNKDGTGDGPWTDLINWVHTKFTELQFYDTATVRVEQTTRGVRFHARPGFGGSGEVGNALKGEYSASTDSSGGYTTGNIVVVSTGDNQGTYGYVNSMASSGAASPWVGGGYWIQLPGGLQSQWM